MAATKKQKVLNYLNLDYSDYHVDYRENSITESYDFVIHTGASKIFLKIGQKRWNDSDSSSIVEFLESKKDQISKVVSDNQNAIVRMS